MRVTGIIVLVFLVFCLGELSSQNLVQNNSFEDAWSCPKSYVTIPVVKPYPKWYNPNKGTPDHLHICSPFEAGIPRNFAGEMFPSDGGAYAGIILREVFYDSTKVVGGVIREYIQNRLSEPLKKDQLYCVKLFYANSSKSLFSVDAMGVALTSERIMTKDPGLIIQRPQVMNKPGNIMNNIDYWQELCGVYRAGGSEEYLTIGNFWDNSITNFKQNEFQTTDAKFVYAYYYIDDVRVFEIDNEFECGCLNDLSFGSDWMSDKYDSETGFNTLNQDDLNYGNTGDGDSKPEVLSMKNSEMISEAFQNASVGDKFNLNRIFFGFNSPDLLTASYSELDKLYQILVEKPSLIIEIRGHTDNVGSTSYNKSLSVKRASSVYQYLLDKGIDKARMKYKGFGNKVPVANNESEEGRRLNRRVEIIIVEL